MSPSSAARGLLGTHVIPTPQAMHALGLQLGAALSAGDLVVLTGPLGAGKTTLSRGVGEALNVRGPITSPTFVIARTHPSLSGGPALVHVDAYRLGSPAELDDLDIDFAHSVVLVEWGAGMLDGVSESWLDVTIERPLGADDDTSDTDAVDSDDTAELNDEPRTVTITGHGPRWQ